MDGSDDLQRIAEETRRKEAAKSGLNPHGGTPMKPQEAAPQKETGGEPHWPFPPAKPD
jgi:hypothetical protein